MEFHVRYPDLHRYVVAPFALLVGATCALLGVAIVAYVAHDDPGVALFGGVAIFGVAGLMLYGSLDALVSRLRISPESVTKRSWYGATTNFAWRDIAAVTWSHWSGYVLRSQYGEVVTISKLMATKAVCAALREHVPPEARGSFPTRDLSPPAVSEPPAKFYWAVGAVFAAFLASRLDWRYLDTRCFAVSAVHVFSTRGDVPRQCLHWAAYEGDADWVRDVLARGADPNAADGDGMVALTFAIVRGHLDAAKALVAGGADPLLPGRFDETPLQAAIAVDERAIVEALVAAVRPKLDGAQSIALLAYARGHERRQIVEFLRATLADRLPRIADPKIATEYRALVEQAAKVGDAGDYEGALRLAESAIELDPATAVAYLQAGYAHRRLKNLGRAKERLRRAVELEPANGLAWAMLGSLQLDTGDHADAERALTRALELGVPDVAAVRSERAVARLELGRRAEALADAKAACTAKPDRELACGLVRELEDEAASREGGGGV